MAEARTNRREQDRGGKAGYPRGHWVNVVTMVAVVIYTGIQMYQTYLIRSNNVVSQRAF